MNTTKLHPFEIEDIEDVLPLFEEIFQITLEDNEIEKLTNFNEFSDLIISKIKFENDHLCTSQRAFYQFRKALISESSSYTVPISPKTVLKHVFPRKGRRKKVAKIEEKLGYKIGILAPSQTTINLLFFLFILSFIALFFIWKIAILGLLISAIGFYLTKFTIRLDKKNVRELITKNTAQNYFKIRNHKNPSNKLEFEEVILKWFSENTGINKNKLKYGTFS